MFSQNTLAARFAVIFAATLATGLAGCGPSGSAPVSHTVVATVHADAGHSTAARHDRTVYIGEEFSDVEQRLARTSHDAAAPAPTF